MKLSTIQNGAVVFCATALLLFCCHAPAEDTAGQVPPVPAPRLEVSEDALDLGLLRANEVANGTVTLTNSGDDTLVISKVLSSCGCTAAVPGKKELAPGESTSLDVKYTAGSAAGKIQKTVTIQSNDLLSPATIVKVTAEVIARALASPKTLNFGSVQLGEATSMELAVTAAGDEPEWKTVRVQPSAPLYGVEPIERSEEDVAARRWRFNVSLKDDAPRGRAYASLSVLVNDEKQAAIRSTAMATVEGEINVTPAFASLYSRGAGLPARTSLFVRHRDKKPFKITEIVSDVPHVVWEIVSKEGSSQHEIKLALKDDTPLDTAFRGKITVRTDQPKDPEISVPLSARLRSAAAPVPQPRSRPVARPPASPRPAPTRQIQPPSPVPSVK
jgi:hypothetical protein